LLATLLGGQGGNAGQIGGLLSTLAITNPQFLQGLSSALGLGDGVGQNLGSLAGILGIAGGGLTGFGLGANHGGFLGALGGAASGALTGFLVGGPAGAIIGGLVGLIGGIFGGIFGGSKRKKQANAYFSDSLEPAIKKIEDEYDSFQLDAQNAKDQLEQLRTQAQTDLGKLKSQGKDVFKKKVGPAIDTAEAHILDTEKERTRRGALAFGAPQFHDGVDFVDANSSILFRRRPDELVSVLQHGEGVVTAAGNARNPGAVAAMNAGAVVGGGGDVHVNLYPQTLDANWLRNGGAVDIAKAIRYATKEGRR
jgi:hypothetical protein